MGGKDLDQENNYIEDIEMAWGREVSSVREEGRMMSGLGHRNKTGTKRVINRCLDVYILKGYSTRKWIMSLRAGFTSSKPMDST